MRRSASQPLPSSAALGVGWDAGSGDIEAELQDFSYTVSHDLAATFRHQAGFSRLLLEELGGRLNSRQQSHADHLLAASDKCQLMLEQLLVHSRLQQKTLDRSRVEADQVVGLLLLQFSAQIAEAEAKVTCESLGEIVADRELLTLALHHLIENAIKFRRSGYPPRIAISCAHDAQTWRVRISDNGPGVPSAYREKAFRMFQRLNPEGVYPGLGAGLAICRRIARRHGGEVSFRDCEDGASIELALPLTPSDSARASAP
jgi:light-regulated signal transduction histidine kinase (bacteriophytochrome)